MQELEEDKDDEWCHRINEAINNLPSTNSILANNNCYDSIKGANEKQEVKATIASNQSK